MDGPNVNWKIFKDLNEELNDTGTGLLNVGSCGLHTLHNAFKASVKDMGVDVYLKSLFIIFDETPARREDFMEMLDHDQNPCFGLRFCNHRWLENILVHDQVLKYYII